MFANERKSQRRTKPTPIRFRLCDHVQIVQINGRTTHFEPRVERIKITGNETNRPRGFQIVEMTGLVIRHFIPPPFDFDFQMTTVRFPETANVKNPVFLRGVFPIRLTAGIVHAAVVNVPRDEPVEIKKPNDRRCQSIRRHDSSKFVRQKSNDHRPRFPTRGSPICPRSRTAN